MASIAKPGLEDGRRTNGSPKLKGRENAKDTLCRNVTIYGRCRYEDKGCAFNHDPQKVNAAQHESGAGVKQKRLNVESPSFTPSTTPNNGTAPTTAITAKKPATLSPKAAGAAPFLPKGSLSRANSGISQLRQETGTPEWGLTDVPDFVPQRFDTVDSIQATSNGVLAAGNAYDPFVSTTTPLGTAGAVVTHPLQPNPYAHDHTGIGPTSYFTAQSTFQQPAQYHLYAPIGPHNQNILGYQRNVHDLFIPNDFREELQKKAAATLQTLPNSQLPTQIDHFHSLVPLDVTHQKNATIFGYPSWVYKAQSSKDGNYYVLRRLEGFRLTNEKAIRCVQAWKRVISASVVTVHDAFTNRSFQDSSLIFVTDYHPLSKTLAEQHLESPTRYQNRHASTHVTEPVLWGYVTQIASALKAIHSAGLAARVIDASKILLTGKNRIRLNACAILDVVQHDTQRSIADLQSNDMVSFGQLILTLGASSLAHNPTKALEHFSRAYSAQLYNSVLWLLGAGPSKEPQGQPQPANASQNPNANANASANQNANQVSDRTIDVFITGISTQLISTFDSSLHVDDELTHDLSRELENARLVRLLTKLNFITERPEYDHDRHWSENGERYFLKLFRDYVFHQVDSQNAPVVDLGHVLTCLNKLDAGSEEKVTLISRDEQSCFVVSYKELKKGVEMSFQALMKRR
ncbi:PAN2-PAN3 deadenylation complex subunit PAN3 [Trichophyton interdigitale]|uniref:PAN2-PAN3 deadenylation complex subunit PAN3 n=1 Tax=Trichophyton interdigitale TaxID=101480 RepID=A0A9P5CW30_9EURO|nr:PAN2-PAN3 deadenylation complex subunit PAN3 [Trichophyton interdigitale]KAF3898522.1 PAN2-PAN3 deadenylation complex subunit PAN3 [Trichophyton interdigitale]KAG8212283.1 PAN2-PAN3 deadenylation complex subunit PAN3 [Trichophyton interdigitale]